MYQSDKYKVENQISRELKKKGYSRNAVRLWLIGPKGKPIDYKTLGKYMKNPYQYMTIQHLEIIAGKLDKPLTYVLALIRGSNKSGAKRWHEDNKDAFK